MKDLRIIILGEVQSQLRPIISTKAEDKKATAIDPTKCREYKSKVKQTAVNFIGEDFEILDEPLFVDIKVFMGVTKSWSKKKKAQALSGELMPTYKKDLDNLAKGLLDGCTGTVWNDDGCIVDLRISKRYSGVPRAEITVVKISEIKEYRNDRPYINN